MTVDARAAGEETTRKFVTYSLSIDGDKKTVTSITDKAESIPEEFKKLNVKLTNVDDPSIVYEGASGPWRGFEGYSVVENYDTEGIPAGKYKIEISGFDAENSKYKIVKGEENPLIDREVLTVNKGTGNQLYIL